MDAGKWLWYPPPDHDKRRHALYCYANPSGTTYTLFKSTDSGRSWTTTGKVTDVIIDIAALSQDTATIYYATNSRIYKSIDAGNTFISLPSNPGGAGSGNVSITSIDVAHVGNANTVAVSTVDTDATQYGGVYLLEESQFRGAWINTGIGNYDVYRVTFSPNYPNDRHLIAIASDEVDTYAVSRIYTGNWGQMIGNARITGIVPSAANITFPDSYNGMSDNATFFLGIDTGANSGDVYKEATPLSLSMPSLFWVCHYLVLSFNAATKEFALFMSLPSARFLFIYSSKMLNTATSAT